MSNGLNDGVAGESGLKLDLESGLGSSDFGSVGDDEGKSGGGSGDSGDGEVGAGDAEAVDGVGNVLHPLDLVVGVDVLVEAPGDAVGSADFVLDRVAVGVAEGEATGLVLGVELGGGGDGRERDRGDSSGKGPKN